jgi:hypothetical protein
MELNWWIESIGSFTTTELVVATTPFFLVETAHSPAATRVPRRGPTRPAVPTNGTVEAASDTSHLYK